MRKRIVSLSFVVPVAIFLCGLCAAAQSVTSGRTFYIDYASGSNSNNGTSIATPWKSHPYMNTSPSCTGTGKVPTYSHQPGDRFIFKGGVTWPKECFAMTITVGGSSTSWDYYGTGETIGISYGSGKAVFDLANTVVTVNGCYGNQSVICSLANNITFDGLEVKRYGIVTGGGVSNCGFELNFTNAKVTHSSAHSWYNTSDWGSSGLLASEAGAFCHSGGIIEFSEAYGQTTAPLTGANRRTGSCFRSVNEVSHSVCHDAMNGVWGGFKIHDNEFYNIYDECCTDGLTHTNLIEMFYPNPLVYNNVMHDVHVGQQVGVCGIGATIFNNVAWNISGGAAIFALDAEPSGACEAKNPPGDNRIFNNTASCGGIACFRVGQRSGLPNIGGVYLENNHWITDNSTVSCTNSNGQQASCTSVVTSWNPGTNNKTQGTAAAAAQNYNIGGLWSPQASGVATDIAGTNLSSWCSSYSALCYDTSGATWFTRVATTSGNARVTSKWNAGAYQLGSVTSAAPAPPTNLTVMVQ